MSGAGGRPQRILLVTGMSGAGKSTALNTFEDMGWEVVDNLPLPLLERLLDAPVAAGAQDAERPLAVGVDSRTRGFDPAAIVRRIQQLSEQGGHDVATLFLDCAGAELERRYAETRRRHPLAQDRPAADGIARERELMAPIRGGAEHLVDTTAFSSNALQAEIRSRFGETNARPTTISVMSFGFSRGVPRNADLMFDMRFLRNPHWVPDLKPKSGLDSDVAAYVTEDVLYEPALARIEDLLLLLLPRYESEGKAYVTIALGCTGGRHRSVHCAERIAQRLRKAGFSPTVHHRDLASKPQDALEGMPVGQQGLK